jgi:hypothetical protein
VSLFVAKLAQRVALLGACCLLGSGSALAHIKNEASQFPDIEFSQARFDIVVLVGAGIIPETPVFEPDKPLSKREIAAWAALANGLGAGGETPDVDALAATALEQGLVDTLDGEASYADLNVLFFEGEVTLDAAQRIPTKAEAATFIAEHLETETGQALLTSRNLHGGAVGTVAAIKSQAGDHHGSAYVITVGDTALPMYAHGRVANGPTDLLQWQGREVRRSFVRGEGKEATWIYLEAEPLVDATKAAVAGPAADPVNEPPSADHTLLYVLVAGVLVLGLLLFFRRRRSG